MLVAPFTAEQEALRSMLADFARDELLPGAAERDASRRYPAGLVARLGELGLMGIAVPEEDGGLGLDTATQLLAVEGVAYGDAALASIQTAHLLGLEPLLLAGDRDQRRRHLAPLAAGEALAGFALTEPDAGSDIGALATRAEPDGSGFRLTGSKLFISNAQEARILTVFAKTDREAGFGGIGAFLVPTDAPGLTFSAPLDLSGIRSAPVYGLGLDEVAVGRDALLGAPGEGGRLALEALNRARIDIAAMANGIALRALDLAFAHAEAREQFGRPIVEHQAVALLLGEADALVETARLAAFAAATAKDAGRDLRRPASIAKLVATESCFRVVDHALQVHGGAGYVRDSEIERLYRDCRVLRLYEGTSQIQLLTIARARRRAGAAR